MASHSLKKASDFLTSAKSDNIDKASKEARATDQSYGQLKAKAYLQSEEYKALFDHEHKAMREAERKKSERQVEEPKKKKATKGEYNGKDSKCAGARDRTSGGGKSVRRNNAGIESRA